MNPIQEVIRSIIKTEGLGDETIAIPTLNDLLLSVRFFYINYRFISFPERLSPNFSFNPPGCAIGCSFETSC